MTASAYITRLALLGLILIVNAFFAAAEVSLLSVRESRLRHLAEEGVSGAKAALALLANPEKLLAATQIGVTLASLGLGWAGEDTLYNLFLAIFPVHLGAPAEAIVQGGCFVLAFILMTYCHVVIGEVVPKNLAIEKADRLAVVVAPILSVIVRIESPFVAVVEKSSNFFTRLAGVTPTGHRGGGHSTEELKLVVSSSRISGVLPESQEGIIHRVLDLNDLGVREIMRPRHEIISIPVTASLDEVLNTMVESRHSRLPVWDGEPEHMVGMVFFKDMLWLWQERRQCTQSGRTPPMFHMQRLMRKPVIVPESKSVHDMLEEFRSGHTHMALVVDEFGTVTGLLTVEDVLEQIVGKIADEFDDHEARPEPEADVVDLDGATSIRDLNGLHGVELPLNAGFETLAGYILSQLGHIPKEGEAVEFEGRRFTVQAMERNRIAQVHVEKLSVPEEETAEETPVAGS